MGNAKIFIGERRKVGEGEKKPRYPVVGVAGTDLKIHAQHIRKWRLTRLLDMILRSDSVTKIHIINGLKPGNISRALNGEHVGTIIYKDILSTET